MRIPRLAMLRHVAVARPFSLQPAARVYYALSIRLSADACVGCFQLLTLMNNTAKNIHVKINVWTHTHTHIWGG